MSVWSLLLERAVQPVATKALLAWERLESGVSYLPGSPESIVDPYPLYADLRRRDPVHRMRILNGFALTRYRDIDRVLRDHTSFSSSAQTDVLHRTGLVTMLDTDPPDHTRLRSLVSQAFTPRAIEGLRSRIGAIADDLVARAAAKPRFDLMAAIAYPLPITVIAEMLGVPPEDMARFERWSADIALNVEPMLNSEGVDRVRSAAAELAAYFEHIISLRRADPRDDMISALVFAEEEGEKLTHDELIQTLILLLVAGNETTRNLIGNGMLALLSNPGQLRLLRKQPGLMRPAVRELLRYDSPVQLDGRIATLDVELGGRRIRKGQILIAVIGAANRDPEKFENPDTLDIRRNGTSHLSFGRGIHYCLGAPLAEMEGQIAFTAILQRFRSMRVAGKPVHRSQTVLRGLEHLWIETGGSSGACRDHPAAAG